MCLNLSALALVSSGEIGGETRVIGGVPNDWSVYSVRVKGLRWGAVGIRRREVPEPTSSIAHARNYLRIAGDVIMQGLNMSLPPTWSEVIQKLSQSYRVTSNCRDYTYENYWMKTKPKEGTYPAFSSNMGDLDLSINALANNPQQF